MIILARAPFPLVDKCILSFENIFSTRPLSFLKQEDLSSRTKLFKEHSLRIPKWMGYYKCFVRTSTWYILG